MRTANPALSRFAELQVKSWSLPRFERPAVVEELSRIYIPANLHLLLTTKLKSLASKRLRCWQDPCVMCKNCNVGRNQGFIGCVMEPTGPLIRDIWISEFDSYLEQYEIDYTFRASPPPEYILHLPGGHQILCRSFENYQRIIGLNLSFCCVDEIDTVAPMIATGHFRSSRSFAFR